MRGWHFPERCSLQGYEYTRHNRCRRYPVSTEQCILRKARRNLFFLTAQSWRPSAKYEQGHSSFVPPSAAADTAIAHEAAVVNRSPPSSIVVLRHASNRAGVAPYRPLCVRFYTAEGGRPSTVPCVRIYIAGGDSSTVPCVSFCVEAGETFEGGGGVR